MSGSDAAATAALKAALVTDVSETLAFNDFTVACIVVLYYDHLITLGDEIELVWKSKWSFGKVLFLLNRYLQPIDLLILTLSYADLNFPENACVPWFFIDTWEGVIVEYIINIMLLMRTWALWDRSKKVLIMLIVVLILTMSSYTFGGIWGSVQFIPLKKSAVTFIHPCVYGIGHTEDLYSIWVALIAWDAFVIVLLLIKIVPLLSQGISSPLIRQIFVDGYIFFFAIALSSLANILMIRFAPGELATMMFTFHRVIATVLCSRMILNLRGSLLRPLEVTTGASMTLLNTRKKNTHGGTMLSDIELKSIPLSPHEEESQLRSFGPYDSFAGRH